MQTPTERRLLLTWPQECFNILLERRDHRLMIVHETHIELVGGVNADGIDESKITKVHFLRTYWSWTSAWRVARMLANASRGLKAQIAYVDICSIPRIDLGIDLVGAYDIEPV